MESKAFVLLCRYYGGRIVKSSLSRLPFVLFAISLGLFLIALVPALRDRLRESQLFARQAETIEFYGRVTEHRTDSKGVSTTIALPGVAVEIGASKAITGQDGEYDLRAQAIPGENVPVIFTEHQNSVIDRVSVPTHDKKVYHEFTFLR